MPGNQPANNNLQPPTISSGKSPLVRSKSLRLSSSRPKLEQTGTSTLTRHGSIRGPKPRISVPTSSSTTSSSKPPFSLFKKPPLKPKPTFGGSKSEESSHKSNVNEGENRKNSAFSPTKHSDLRYASLSDMHRTPSSESPTSLHSEKSHSVDTNSWCKVDLASHLKRLTEEHEKLQVEYARVRLQLLENVALHPVSNLKKEQHLSQSDSHLASIPENSPDADSSLKSLAQTQETLIQNYKNEILRLHEDNRKLQRKYWEQMLNSESVIDEPCNGASQQIVDLIDKLDDKEKEFLEATGRVQELENHLAAATFELQQCQDALQDQQRMLEESNIFRDESRKHLRELKSALRDAREQIEFLQNERSSFAEAYQETEQALQATKVEWMKEQSKCSDLMDKSRKLYSKVKEKALQVQILQAELDRTQGSCRDILLSQGAELTMISMHLSQMSMTVHSLLTAAADFAASELSLQKEMLEEIMADLDSESEPSHSPSDQNGFLKSDSQIPNSLASSHHSNLLDDRQADVHKSLPDIFNSEPVKPLYSPAASESERPVSLVQSIVRAYEQSSKSDLKPSKQVQSKSVSEQNTDSNKSSVENLSSLNGDLSHVSSLSKDSSPVANSAFRPVGMATAFRPVRQRSLELEISPLEHVSSEEEKKASLETQINQMNCLIKKLGKVIELTQEKFSSKIKTIIIEKNAIQEELFSFKNKTYQMKADLSNKDYLIEREKEKIKQLETELKNLENKYSQENKDLTKKNSELTEELKCLEAVNSEISNQLNLKLVQCVTEPNSEFRTNASEICDKLNLKQEIAKLKAKLELKENVLQQLAQKFTRTNNCHEQNLKQAGEEIKILDTVISKVYATLDSNPDLVEKYEVLRDLKGLVSGNCTLPNVCLKEEKS